MSFSVPGVILTFRGKVRRDCSRTPKVVAERLLVHVGLELGPAPETRPWVWLSS